jgi:putative protein-disulfide isomerase
MEPPDIELVYVGDTMCSWCWGFAPTIDALGEHYSFAMRLVNGGLRPGPGAQVLEDGLRSYLIHHWDQVAAASGQPFNEKALAGDGWVYDTEYPARAVVTMRALSPNHEFEWFKRLQRAFYSEAIDITDGAVYPGLLADFPVDVDDFVAQLDDEKSRLAAWEDFEEARSLQATGFPTLLLRAGSEMATVTRGYRSFDDIEPYLTTYLADRYEPAQFLA